MIQGKVTEYAKRKFENGNKDIKQYLSQVSQQINNELHPKTHHGPVADSNIQTETSPEERALNKQLHDSVQGLLNLSKKPENDGVRFEPHHQILAQEPAAPVIGPKSQLVKVPIDEVDSIGVVVKPTHQLDDIKSVTLKSFRKIIGYDTFDAIRNGKRDERKNVNDYYNVTVSMLIER